MNKSMWMGAFCVLSACAADAGMSAPEDTQIVEASAQTLQATGIARWRFDAKSHGTYLAGETSTGARRLEVETVLDDDGFMLLEHYYDERGAQLDAHETRFGSRVGVNKQALTQVGAAQQALTANPSNLIGSLNGDIMIAIDPNGGILTPGGTKKTPCEKASNQFYRAQAAYLAAASALNACGFSFTPGCEALAASFNAAAATLDSAYAKFTNEC